MIDIPPAFGPPLAILGGTLYAVAALMTSLAVKRHEEGVPGWTEERLTLFKRIAFLCLITGGLCVTFCYGTGNSVPLMNAMVYATNLVLNMSSQIFTQLTTYTKLMRNGTLLFMIATVQLAFLSPPPQEKATIDISAPLNAASLAWEACFVCIGIGAGMVILSTRSLSRSSAVKTLGYSIFIAFIGSLTDQWAKINGVANWASWILLLSNVLYFAVAIVLMIFSVTAMEQCEVAVYVPTNLCSQLCLNVCFEFFVWGLADRTDKTVPLIIGYGLCAAGVYIASPALDIGASISAMRERFSAKMGQNIAVTRFGRVVVELLTAWENSKDGQGADKATEPGVEALEVNKTPVTQSALVAVMKEGHDSRIYDPEQMGELLMTLWKLGNPQFKPTPEIIEWMRNTQYFQSYCEKDSNFHSTLDDLKKSG